MLKIDQHFFSHSYPSNSKFTLRPSFLYNPSILPVPHYHSLSSINPESCLSKTEHSTKSARLIRRCVFPTFHDLPPNMRTISPKKYTDLGMIKLSKYPMLNNFEKQTSVPKVYAFLGLVGIYFFLVFFNIAGEFLVNFAGFLVPGYYSLEALFSASKVDDTQV